MAKIDTFKELAERLAIETLTQFGGPDMATMQVELCKFMYFAERFIVAMMDCPEVVADVDKANLHGGVFIHWHRHPQLIPPGSVLIAVPAQEIGLPRPFTAGHLSDIENPMQFAAPDSQEVAEAMKRRKCDDTF